MRDWLKRKGQQARWPGKPSPPLDYPHNKHIARKLAAALTLLALGTNSNGGLCRLLEARAIAPEPNNSLGSYLTFLSRGNFPLEYAIAMGFNNLPDRQEEIIATITAGLYHTNAAIREGAAISAEMYMHFKDRNIHITDLVYEKWRTRLITLVHDADINVGCDALKTLISQNPKDDDINVLAESVLRDHTNHSRLRIIVTDQLRLYPKETAAKFLPLLKQVLGDPDLNVRESAGRPLEILKKGGDPSLK